MPSELGPPAFSTRDDSLDRPDSTSTKRRRRSTVRVACNACRMKKTRCDGRRPICSWCASHPGVHCIYDTGSAEETRSAALKRENEILKQNLKRAERLLEDLATLPDHESIDLLKRIRATDNPSESFERNSTRDYAEPLGSAGNTHTSGTMRSIQPMVDGADLVTESHFDSSSVTTISQRSPHDVRNVSLTSFGPPGFSLVVKRPPSETMQVSNEIQRQPNRPTMRTLWDEKEVDPSSPRPEPRSAF